MADKPAAEGSTAASTRREFLRRTTAAAALSAGIGGCAPPPGGQKETAAKPGANDTTKDRPMIDFDRSYFTWTSKPYTPHPYYVNDGGMVQGAGSVRDVRIQYEALCEIRDDKTGHVEELFLLHPCLGEYTIPKRDFFMIPVKEFRVIFTRTHAIPIALRPSTEAEQTAARPHNFDGLRFTTRHHPRVTKLATAKEVIEATLADKPMNCRTQFRDAARGCTVTLEYPVRTMNLNVEEQLFQTDTGPLPLPDLKTWDGQRPGRAFLAHVATSRFDFAEFILRREVEPSDKDKEWLFKVRGKWRWELRDPKKAPPGHPPRPAWPFAYNETMRLDTINEFLVAEGG
jgi:hypothetical protein